MNLSWERIRTLKPSHLLWPALLFVGIFVFAPGSPWSDVKVASAQTSYYRSVAPSATSAITTGASATLTISGTTATFSAGLPDNVGVGDAIQYDSDGNGSINAIAFIHGRTSSTVYTVMSAAAGTPTAVTGDSDWSLFRAYTTLANAEAGDENDGLDDAVEAFESWAAGQNISSANAIWNIAVYANGTTADTVPVFIDGWTTSATNYINIFTPTQTSQVGASQRHAGTWDTSKYHLQAITTPLVLRDEFIRVTGLQIYEAGQTGIHPPNQKGVDFGSGAHSTGGNHFSHNILRGSNNADGHDGLSFNTNSSNVSYVWNNIIYDWVNCAEYAFLSASVYLYNNTVHNCSVGMLGNVNRIIAKNNIVQDSTTAYSGTFHASSEYNVSDDGTQPGANGQNGEVAFVNEGSDNFLLDASDTVAKDNGVDLSADATFPFSDDILGVTRAGTWDMGAHEFFPAGITVSGNIITAVSEGAYDCADNNLTVALRVNGTDHSDSVTCTAGTGAFSFSEVSLDAVGDVITIFLDGETEKATYVTRVSATDTNITGVNVYTSSLIVTTETGGDPITNANLDEFDNGCSAGAGDSDAVFCVDSGQLTVSEGFAMSVIGDYTPGGSITTSPSADGSDSNIDGDFFMGAEFEIEANTLTVGGDFLREGGTFAHSGAQTTVFTATATGHTITTGGDDFNNVTFNGSGGGWSNSGAMTVTGDLVMTAGTFSGTANVTVNGGDVTGNGTITRTGGTFLLDGAGNFGGDTTWTFSNLTFGNGSGATATTATGTGSVSVSSVLTVAANQTLNAGSKTWTLSGSGTPFAVSGTFNYDTSTMQFTGTSATSIIRSVEYYNLSVIPAATVTHTIATSGNLSVNGNLVLGNGTNALTMDLATNANNLVLGGSNNSMTLAANVTLQVSDGALRFMGSGTQHFTDNTASLQDLGWVRIQGSSKTLALNTDMRTGALTVEASNTLDLNGANMLWLTGRNGFDVSGTFEASTGTVRFTGGSQVSETNIPNLTYYNLEVYGMDSANLPVNLGSDTGQTIVVENNLILGNGTDSFSLDVTAYDPTLDVGNNVTINASATLVGSNSGSFTVGGSWTNAGTFTHSSGTVTFDASDTGNIIDGPNATTFGTVTFNNATGGWDMDHAMTAATALNITAGTFSQGASYTLTSGTVTVGASGTWSNLGTGDLVLSGDVSNAGNITLNSNNGTQCVNAADDIAITSSVGATQRTWSGAGTFTLINLDVTDMAGTVTVYRSALSNTAWTVGTCGITVSGTSNGTGTVGIAVNGVLSGVTTTISAGTWALAEVSVTSGNVVTVWIDGVADASESTAVAQYDGTGDMTGLVLDANVLSVGSVDDQTISLADLDLYDCSSDEDIMYRVNSVTFEVQGASTCPNSYTDETISILSGDTLAIGTGETMTTDNITMAGTLTKTTTAVITASGNYTQSAGTFNGGSGNMSVAGSFTLSGGTFTSTTGNLTVNGHWTHTAGGTFTHNSGTVIAWPTGHNTWDVNTTETFHNFTMDPSTAWSLTIASGDTLVVENTFTHNESSINTGTVAVHDNMVIGTDAAGGTATILFDQAGDQTITGNSTGYTANITVSKPSGTVSTTSGDVHLVTFTLTSGTFIAPSGILAPRGDWVHTAGGTFTHNSGTVSARPSSARTWNFNTTETFHNFIMEPGTTWTLTISSGDTLIVEGTFTHSNSSINTGTIAIHGNMVIGAGADGGTAIILYDQSGDEAITGSAVGFAAHLTVSKPSGTLSVTGDLVVDDFTLTSGTFLAPSGTFSVRGDWTHTAGGTFSHNNGTVLAVSVGFPNWDVATSETFYNLNMNKSSAWTLTIASGDTLIVTNTFTHTEGVINTGTIEAQGNVSIGVGADAGTAQLKFSGTAVQTYTDAGGNEMNGDVTVDKTGGSITLASDVDWNFTNQDLIITQGTFSQGSTFTLRTGAVTVGASGTWSNLGTGDVVLGGNVANAGTITINSNNGDVCTDATDDIAITSSVGATQRTWSGAGTFTLANLAVTDMAGSVSAYHSTFTNTTWSVAICGVDISGFIYSDEGSTALDCSTGNRTVRLKLDGAGDYSADCSQNTGAFSISTVPAEAGDVLTIYLDGETEKAALILLASGSDTLDANLRLNRLVIRHDDATPVTNAMLGLYDNDDDADLIFTANTGDLVVKNGYKLIINGGDTYAPGGDVNMSPSADGTDTDLDGDLLISGGATLEMTTESLSVGGDFTNSGTFSSSGAQTTTFTATAVGHAVDMGTGNLNHVTFDGVGGGWSFPDADNTVDGDLVVSNGTLSGTTNLTVSGGAVTGNGSVAMTGGTFLVDGTGDLGGDSDWTFSTLTLGDGSGSGTVSAIGSGTVTVAVTMTVSANQSLDAGDKHVVLSGASPLTVTGNADLSTSTFEFSNASATLPNLSFHHLTLSAAETTYEKADLPDTITGTLTLGEDTTLDLDTADESMDLSGLVINGTVLAPSGATLTVAGPFTNNGTFAHNNGTVRLDPSAGQDVTVGGTAATTFYDLEVSDGGNILFEAGDTFIVEHAMDIQGESGQAVYLQSSTPTSTWTIRFNGSSPILRYVIIRDSACHASSASIQTTSSNSQHVFNGGNNGACWIFLNRGAGNSSGGGSGGEGSEGGGGSSGGSGGTGGGSGGEGSEGGGGSGGGGGGSP